jgi:DNA-binding transcriptional ArsR family regulator
LSPGLQSRAVDQDRPALDPQLVKAISHPLRHRLLVLLNEREASPKELADELGEPIGRVSHHIRTLARLGAITLTRTRPRRGAVEHFYRARIRAWFTDDDWATLPLSTRRGIFDEYLQRINRDVVAAVAGGGFDHLQAHVSYTLVELDETGMARVAGILEDALERVLDVNAECAQRRAADEKASPTHAEVAILLFERAT